jgi:transcriptional regulator with XRE-family HTH domain
MYYTVKTLLSKGISQRKIAKDLGISRNTVAKIAEKIAAGQSWPTLQTRNKKLSDYHDQIKELVTLPLLLLIFVRIRAYFRHKLR